MPNVNSKSDLHDMQYARGQRSVSRVPFLPHIMCVEQCSYKVYIHVNVVVICECCHLPLPLTQSVHECQEGVAGSMSHGGPAAGNRASGETGSETSLPDQGPTLCQTHQERQKGKGDFYCGN